MLSGTTGLLSILVIFVVVVLQHSGSQAYQTMGSFPLSAREERQIFRRDHDTPSDRAIFPKLTSDLFGSISDDSSNLSGYQEENDSSLPSDEASLLDLPIGHPSQMSKRRKGPTLSVVNPLEILRQRLMLDLARRRIHENQQQIVANAQLLENIGKRSPSNLLRHADAEGDLRDGNYQA